MIGMDKKPMASQSSSMGLNVLMGCHFGFLPGRVNSSRSKSDS